MLFIGLSRKRVGKIVKNIAESWYELIAIAGAKAKIYRALFLLDGFFFLLLFAPIYSILPSRIPMPSRNIRHIGVGQWHLVIALSDEI